MIRRALGLAGIYAGRVKNRPFGQDMLLDMQRLANAWGMRLRTILDVGANAGQSALHFRNVFPSARIFSFEPHPETFARLESAIRGRPNLEALNLALGDTAGEVDFFEYENSLINGRVSDAAYPKRKGLKPKVIKVNQQTIDGFCIDGDLERVDFLKIDAEGFEPAVLAGARRMLAEGRIGFISCEVGICGQGKVSDAADLAALMKPFGYVQFSTYFDYVIPEPPFFANGNVLFIPPLNAMQEAARR